MSLARGFIAVATVFGLIFCAVTSWCPAQQPATTVQLPTFSVFTVQTTISVPDGGGAYLGGLKSGASNSSRLGVGPFQHRAMSGTRAASGVSVSATVIDHDEIDRALLAEAATKRGPADSANAKAASLSKTVSRTDARVADARVAGGGSADHGSFALPGSVAAIREQNAAAADLQTAELAGYLAKARQAEADNKPGVAKVFYQMVARRDNGTMKKEATERLAYLTGGKR